LPSSTTASNGGASVAINAIPPTNEFSPTVQLTPSKTYYWEVHAQPAGTDDGVWSSVQSFSVAPVPSGLTIVPTWDSTITSDPNAATIEATINAAISVYRYNYSDNVTAQFTFVTWDSTLGYNDSYETSETYTAYRAALVSHATTADDSAALAHLANTTDNPVNGNANMDLKQPLARALGFSTLGGQDSTVYLNTSMMNLSSFQTDPTKYSLFATVSHEMDEALGLGSILNGMSNGDPNPSGSIEPEDLFRYDGSGDRTLSTESNAIAYFSLDGTTDLAQFNQYDEGDFGDWYSFYGGNVPQVQDAFATPGANPVLDVELRVLDVIGFTRVIQTTNGGAPTLSAAAVSGGNFLFTLNGSAGSYVIQASSNLVTWLPLSTNTVGGSGSVSVTNAVGSNPHRFFRAVTP
jgi:hypothetical protein